MTGARKKQLGHFELGPDWVWWLMGVFIWVGVLASLGFVGWCIWWLVERAGAA